MVKDKSIKRLFLYVVKGFQSILVVGWLYKNVMPFIVDNYSSSKFKNTGFQKNVT